MTIANMPIKSIKFFLLYTVYPEKISLKILELSSGIAVMLNRQNVQSETDTAMF